MKRVVFDSNPPIQPAIFYALFLPDLAERQWSSIRLVPLHRPQCHASSRRQRSAAGQYLHPHLYILRQRRSISCGGYCLRQYRRDSKIGTRWIRWSFRKRSCVVKHLSDTMVSPFFCSRNKSGREILKRHWQRRQGAGLGSPAYKGIFIPRDEIWPHLPVAVVLKAEALVNRSQFWTRGFAVQPQIGSAEGTRAINCPIQ